MKKLHRKLLNHRKAANNLACKTFRNSEGKPYYTHHYIEDRDIYWCDVEFRKGKKVYNATFHGLTVSIDDVVADCAYKHPDYALLPRKNSNLGSYPDYEALIALKKRIHEEGVKVCTGVKIMSDYQWGTGLIVSFPSSTFTENDIIDFINTWDGTNKNWGEFNSKDFPFTQEVYANQIKI